MTEPDPILLRIEAFDRQNGGGVSVCKSRGGYTLTLTATQAPIARLKPEGQGDRMRLYYWSWQNRWKDVRRTWAASCSRSTKHSTRSQIPTSSGPGPEDKFYRKMYKVELRWSEAAYRDCGRDYPASEFYPSRRTHIGVGLVNAGPDYRSAARSSSKASCSNPVNRGCSSVLDRD